MFESLYNGVVSRTMTPVATMLSWVRQRVRTFCAAKNQQDGEKVNSLEQARLTVVGLSNSLAMFMNMVLRHAMTANDTKSACSP